MNSIKLIKQRVCLAIFCVGICLSAIEQIDNSLTKEPVTEGKVTIILQK